MGIFPTWVMAGQLRRLHMHMVNARDAWRLMPSFRPLPRALTTAAMMNITTYIRIVQVIGRTAAPRPPC